MKWSARCVVLVAVLAVVVPVSVQAKPKPVSLKTLWAEATVATWRCQDQLGVPRTQARYSPWAPHSKAFRVVQLNNWLLAKGRCLERLHNRRLVTWDWLTAVDLVQRAYPGTKSWLLYISDREGGWGRFVMNRQGSGAGGWMQFMASTFYAYNDRAFADIRRRGFIVPERFNDWRHPLGQAVTAAYMRYTGLDGCHWCL